jgi:hypothetical protein
MNMDLLFGIVMIVLTVLVVGIGLTFSSKPKDSIGSSNGLNCFDLCGRPTQGSGGCSTVCSYGWQ